MAIICKGLYELGVIKGNSNNNQTCEVINTATENDIIDKYITLREKCLHSEFFWSVFSRIRTLSVFSPNAGKYGPEKLRIRTLFTQ